MGSSGLSDINQVYHFVGVLNGTNRPQAEKYSFLQEHHLFALDTSAIPNVGNALP